MFFNDQLMDSTTLCATSMGKAHERQWHVQQATMALLDKWFTMIEDEHMVPQFFIRPDDCGISSD